MLLNGMSQRRSAVDGQVLDRLVNGSLRIRYEAKRRPPVSRIRQVSTDQITGMLTVPGVSLSSAERVFAFGDDGKIRAVPLTDSTEAPA